MANASMLWLSLGMAVIPNIVCAFGRPPALSLGRRLLVGQERRAPNPTILLLTNFFLLRSSGRPHMMLTFDQPIESNLADHPQRRRHMTSSAYRSNRMLGQSRKCKRSELPTVTDPAAINNDQH